ncbi:Xaa-Pro peptidase family protein [Pseudoalteromonas xiamenensis]|uniref:M24 family metallopeptidase n=1 Tax=Pseudoalteromonas xiamenensis TaxID=882626 RepID=UPI0027E3B898|nr:Xaa-Pro peptidase family protein [Pseudoalteromonas xiamenensis]WMN60036.1 Xaa-Pro peptidase family protein [Pseudoalteromonas xiamenensis]
MKAMYLERQAQALTKIHSAGLEALLILGYENIRYLTGYSGNAAYLILKPSGNVLITDYRYFERAKAETHGAELFERDREAQTLGSAIASFLIDETKVGFESAFVSVATWHDVAKDLSHLTLIAKNGLIESLRVVKSSWELASMRKAAAIADEALAETLKYIDAGCTEHEIATELDYRMKKLGSDGVSFDTIMLFGARSALPHGKPGNTTLNEGDFVLIDFGAVINGYRSDMTRSYVFGDPSEKQKHLFRAVEEAQQACFDILRSGLDCKTLNATSENVLKQFGYESYMGKGLGHGVGLFLHEFPFINRTTDHQLEIGNVITIEPGVYVPDFGGVRLEDDVVITEHGFEFITHAPKSIRW